MCVYLYTYTFCVPEPDGEIFSPKEQYSASTEFGTLLFKLNFL